MEKKMIKRECKSIIAVLTALVLAAVMVVSIPGVTTWADNYDFDTVGAEAGGVAVWDTAANGGLGQSLSSGTIKAGQTLSATIGEFSPYVLDGIENYATVVSTETQGGNTTTLYRFTKNASFSCDGNTILFLAGPADAAGAGEGAGAAIGFSPEQIAWAQYHDHAHNSNDTGFTYIVTTPVSEYSDGVEVYGCPECGYKEYSSPISAFDFFNGVTARRIKVAKPGQTIEIEAGQWISFQKELIDALKMKADDITVVIRYKYQGQLWTLTIPRGTDYSNVPEDKCIGLVNLGGCLGLDPVAKY